MKSRLPAAAYISEEWFAREQQQLMRPLWQFVAPKMLLSRPNAFVRRRLVGVDVVVQNHNGQLSALENVCAHRLSPLQTDTHGVRPLVCPYHAWRYDVNGKVDHIPFHDACYRLTTQERETLGLRRFHVFEFGNLVFVNLSPEPLDFWSQFSAEAVASLREASNLFDSEVLVATFKTKFNWKLIYENLRDGMHPRFLHAKTLYRHVKADPQMDESKLADTRQYLQTGVDDANAHLERLRRFSGGGAIDPMPNMPKYHWHQHVERYGQDDWYLNWLMYPNLHIASSTGGHSFIIEHHIPVSAGRTDLMVYYVTGRKTRRYPTSAAVLTAHLAGAEKVLREDIDAMELVQQAITAEAPAPTTGDFEYENMAVERWYLDVMEGRHAL